MQEGRKPASKSVDPSATPTAQRSLDQRVKDSNGKANIVKRYSIDVSSQDLPLMHKKNSLWKQTVAVDSQLTGATNMRLTANKVGGEETPARVII